MAKKYPCKDEILQRLDYCSLTGMFTSKLSGKKVGYKDKHGYIVINIFDQEYRAHRLAMVLSGLELQDFEVDHANGVRDDNRICNLKLVTKKTNAKNKRLRSNNSSGLHGVSWDKNLSKWRARISTDKNRHASLGCFLSFFDACCARKSAEVKNSYHVNHGRVFS